MSDTPIYDRLRLEYAWREMNYRYRELGRRQADAMAAFSAAMKEASDRVNAIFAYVATGLWASQAFVDEVARIAPEPDPMAEYLARGLGVSTEEAEVILEKVKGSWDVPLRAACKPAIDFVMNFTDLDHRMVNRARSIVPPPRTLPMHGIRKPQTRSLAQPQIIRGRKR